MIPCRVYILFLGLGGFHMEKIVLVCPGSYLETSGIKKKRCHQVCDLWSVQLQNSVRLALKICLPCSNPIAINYTTIAITVTDPKTITANHTPILLGFLFHISTICSSSVSETLSIAIFMR